MFLKASKPNTKLKSNNFSIAVFKFVACLVAILIMLFSIVFMKVKSANVFKQF